MKRRWIGAAAAFGLMVAGTDASLAEQQPGQDANPSDQTARAIPHVDPEKIRAEGGAEITKDRAARIAELLMATAPPQPVNVSTIVHVGAPLPGGVDLAPLPTTVVDLVPEYRDYDYVVVNNQIVFVKPSTRQVVEVINIGGG